MIGRVSGKLIARHPPQVIVDVHGIGYEIDVPMSTFYQLPAAGSDVTLFTQLIVREDAHLLYGFATEQERHVFRQLLKISGVGARTALAVLSGLSVSDSNFGIQWHIVAMYGPSFFTGALIARFGAPVIVAIGLLLEAAAAGIGLSGITAPHFWATLIVLGAGWNFSFVGASAMVLETHRPNERNKVQAFNDFLIFGTMAVGSFASGKLLVTAGWEAVNAVVLPTVMEAGLLLAWLAVRWRPFAARD